MLRAAYKKPGDWTAVSSEKMAVAGSQTKRDWWDNFTKIPVWGDLRKSERFGQLNAALLKNPETKQLVGHSLSGSVILEKQIRNPGKYETTTYNAPVFQPFSTAQGQRYTFKNDPVSMFDRGVRSFDKNTINPVKAHSYKNQPDGYASNTVLPDNTQILIE